MDSLDRAGGRRGIGIHDKCARMVLREVAEVPSPKILELGAGLGGLSRKLLDKHPTAQVTVTDIEPAFAAGMAMQATSAITPAPRCGKWMPPKSMRRKAITTSRCSLYRCTTCPLSSPPESSRQAPGRAKKLLIVDLPRPPAPVHIALLAVVLPLIRISPLQHDGFISSLRAYSPSALRALGHHADPSITVEFGLGVDSARRWRSPAAR